MPQIKVIAIQAGEDFLQKLSELLGADLVVATPASPASEPTPEPIPEPSVPFGTETEAVENDYRFKRVFAVPGAAAMDVRVTETGVRVTAESVNGETLNTLVAPNGAFNEVTSFYDVDGETLTVRLFKVDEAGSSVEIVGWEGGSPEDAPVDEDEENWCEECQDYHND